MLRSPCLFNALPYATQRHFFVECDTSNHQFPPLHRAAQHGNIKKLKELLAPNVDTTSVNEPVGDFHFTPLHAAALGGSAQVAEYLLDSRANPEAREVNGATPLLVAATYGHTDLIKFLLSKGANRASSAKTSFGRHKNPWETDLIFHPGLSNDTNDVLIMEWIKESILASARPCLGVALEATPIHCAAAGGHIDAVKLFLEAGVDINSVCDIGTPLHAAAMTAKPEMIEYLLSKGANPVTSNVTVATPLHWAAYTGNLVSSKLFLSGPGACDINAKALKYRNSTPLHWAAMNGDPEIIKLLISQGSDVNAKCSDGSTPLHWAASHRNLGIVDLIQAKADVHATANDGSTPLHWASFNGSTSSTFLLINGADKMTTTKDGYTSLDVVECAFSAENLGQVSILNHDKLKAVKVTSDRFRPPFWKF